MSAALSVFKSSQKLYKRSHRKVAGKWWIWNAWQSLHFKTLHFTLQTFCVWVDWWNFWGRKGNGKIYTPLQFYKFSPNEPWDLYHHLNMLFRVRMWGFLVWWAVNFFASLVSFSSSRTTFSRPCPSPGGRHRRGRNGSWSHSRAPSKLEIYSKKQSFFLEKKTNGTFGFQLQKTLMFFVENLENVDNILPNPPVTFIPTKK